MFSFICIYLHLFFTNDHSFVISQRPCHNQDDIYEMSTDAAEYIQNNPPRDVLSVKNLSSKVEEMTDGTATMSINSSQKLSHSGDNKTAVETL